MIANNCMSQEVANYLNVSMPRIDVSPQEMVQTIYYLPGNGKNVGHMLAFIEQIPHFQNHPKLRELYRVGRLTLDQTCHLRPSHFTPQTVIEVAKRQLVEAADQAELSDRAGSPLPTKRYRKERT